MSNEDSKLSKIASKIFGPRVITSIYVVFGIVAVGQFILACIDASEEPDPEMPDQASISAVCLLLTVTQFASALFGGTGLKNKSGNWLILTRCISLVNLGITFVLLIITFDELSIAQLIAEDESVAIFMGIQLGQFAVSIFLSFAERYQAKLKQKSAKVVDNTKP